MARSWRLRNRRFGSIAPLKVRFRARWLRAAFGPTAADTRSRPRAEARTFGSEALKPTFVDPTKRRCGLARGPVPN